MEWSAQQEQALAAVRTWLSSRSGPQVFRLFGFAGTGKSTLAKELAGSVRGSVLFMAFTGKAALVMRKKGCAGASTIHSSIYRSRQDGRTGDFIFELDRDSLVRGASLIVIDEVSMVNEELGRDLLSFGTKILVLGDPFQLPPVQGEGFFTQGEPDIMLTEIHRQAQDNPILWMANAVRSGRRLVCGAYGHCSVIRKSDVPQTEINQLMLSHDQILCGTNRTRQSANQQHRELLGLVNHQFPWRPQVKDKLVCLRNNRNKGLLNGSLWQVDTLRAGATVKLGIKSLDDLTKTATTNIEVLPEFFQGKEATLDWKKRRGKDEFTFGNVLTVHKSQGSQWDNVLVFDESYAFNDYSAHHLYTAITRAAEKVTVVV